MPDHADAPMLARCEVAGWVVARELGWTDLVAATVLRPVRIHEDGDEIETALQVVWPALETAGERNATPARCEERQRWQAAIFDAICRNTDRNPGNWGFIRSDWSVRLLDHGYAVEAWPQRPPQSDFVSEAGENEVPGDLREDVQMFLDAPADALRELVSEEAISRLYERAQHIVDAGTLPTL